MRPIALSLLCVFGIGVASLSAKELPRYKDEPPPKAKGCEFMGEGYEKAPGTDTCIKVGGFVRAEGAVRVNR